MVFPLHSLNGFFTTKPQLNDHVGYVQDLELNVPSVINRKEIKTKRPELFLQIPLCKTTLH